MTPLSKDRKNSPGQGALLLGKGGQLRGRIRLFLKGVVAVVPCDSERLLLTHAVFASPRHSKSEHFTRMSLYRVLSDTLLLESKYWLAWLWGDCPGWGLMEGPHFHSNQNLEETTRGSSPLTTIQCQ